MSNHFSAGDLKSPSTGASLDVTDPYVFEAPDNPDRTASPRRAADGTWLSR
jgi:hypothetical protein